MKLRFAVLAVSLGLATPVLAQTAPNGEQLFKQRCQMCHQVKAGAASPLGPNLAGVGGRAAASTGFNYSTALKNSKLVWTPQNLDKFLTAPMKLVPGTKMVIALPDAKQRAAVVQYLGKVK